MAVIVAVIQVAAQTISVKGRVVDDNNEPVIGASVLVKGTSNGIATDVDGRFTLAGVEQGRTLVVSYVGMRTVHVQAKPTLQITLESLDSELDEVMVVAFGKQTRSSFTGSAAVMDNKKIEQKQLTNVLSGLQGEAAGVQMINNSGSPIATPTLRIRGFSSINAGKDPLVIVDGSPYDGGWNNLNPNDVESVTVLKDAASNALYGARGANGVIMITTKKASAGKATVTLDAKWGVNSRVKRDYDYIDNPGEYYEAYYKALYNYQLNGLMQTPYQAHVNALGNMSSSDTTVGGLGYIAYTVPDGEYLIGENGKLNPHAKLGARVYNNGKFYTILPDDWKDAAYRNGFRQEYNLNITGGNDRAQFYASLGYLDNEGIADNSDLQRYTARLKADYQAKDWLRIGGNVNFTHTTYNYLYSDDTNDIFYAVKNIAPIYPLYIRDGEGNIMKDANGLMYDYGDGAENGLSRAYLPQGNPIQENMLNTQEETDNVFTINGYADIDIIKGLKLTVNGTGTFYNGAWTNTVAPFYGFGSVTYPNGYVYKSSSNTYSYNFQQLLNYTRDFGNHHVEILLGHENYKTDYYSLAGERTGMVSYFENQNLAGAIKVTDASDSASDYNNEGYFFRGQYDYMQKYFGSVSYRRDASSRFHPDHRWGNFFSIGGAWIMTKEPWLKDVKWLQTLKLKASFGQQGNDDIGNFRYADTYTIVNNNGVPALSFSSKGNENITWEKNNNLNIGVEFDMFENRLRGSVEYFYRKTTDMLCFVYAPYSAGYGGSYYNIGDMVNKGIEFDISGDVIRTRQLTWTLNLNATHYKNKITYISEDLKNTTVDGYRGYTSSTKFYGEGLPMYTWYLPKYAGVSEDGQSMWYVRGNNGEMTTTTTYGDADYFTCGDPHPDLYGGFGTSLSYAGFDLSVTFSYSIGGKAYDYDYANSMASPTKNTVGYAIHKDVLNAWSSENTGSNIPRWQFGDENSANMSDRFLTNASYLTLQNINFGYNLPKKWISRLGLSAVRVYVAGDNLYYWSKRKGFDPRGSFTGETSTTHYSAARTVSGGIKVSF